LHFLKVRDKWADKIKPQLDTVQSQTYNCCYHCSQPLKCNIHRPTSQSLATAPKFQRENKPMMKQFDYTAVECATSSRCNIGLDGRPSLLIIITPCLKNFPPCLSLPFLFWKTRRKINRL